MKKWIKQLESLKEEVKNKIEEREVTFDDRSEKWQDSENGEFFQIKTDELQEVVDNIEMTIESINEFIS
jgi:hypothetical protein